jgi:uncharacterized protein (DUF302 family)
MGREHKTTAATLYSEAIKDAFTALETAGFKVIFIGNSRCLLIHNHFTMYHNDNISIDLLITKEMVHKTTAATLYSEAIKDTFTALETAGFKIAKIGKLQGYALMSDIPDSVSLGLYVTRKSAYQGA